MRIPRIYQKQPLAVNAKLVLDSNATHHLVRVLRLKPPAPIIVFNGEGGEYAAQLVELQKRHAVVQIENFIERSVESPLTIHLGQGISRGEKMDYTIQKAVELGINNISPLITERCEVRLGEERWLKRWEHWQGVAISACEQSGRTQLVSINKPMPLEAWLNQHLPGLNLVLHHRTPVKLTDYKKTSTINLLVGPEGGLSPTEILLAEQHGFHALQMGPRVMRTETAALTALAALQFLWGDLGNSFPY